MKGDFYDLYRECFPEDSAECTEIMSSRLDVADRRALYDGGALRSALYLVEKKMFYRGKTVSAPHIVGLGTFAKDRRKGYAERLLIGVLSDVGSPFVTLYPFSHPFYEKYGFAAVSFDFEDKEGTEKIGIDEVKEVYDELCEGLDYYFIRDIDDFDFYRRVFAADGKEYRKCADGIVSPDGFFPKKYRLTEKKGVMARITDLEKALALTETDCETAIRAVDPYVEKNNLVFRLKKGKIVLCDGAEITADIAELTKALFGKSERLKGIFPALNGYLDDKY